MFDRSLKELRDLGGLSAVAAKKADAFIASLTGSSLCTERESFRFTLKGEYRIKNCRKVDLACGYRIVCIQKGRRLALLYIGTHDDCFRWIERHRTSKFDFEGVEEAAWTDVALIRTEEPEAGSREEEEGRLSEQYEEKLVKMVDDTILRKVFSGLVNQQA
jgi:hypothetical protein